MLVAFAYVRMGNSTAAADVTKTTINAGTAGLNALTLTWVAGAVTIIGVHGYDDTSGRREISLFNWGIAGADSDRFNENSQPVGGTAAMMEPAEISCHELSHMPRRDCNPAVTGRTLSDCTRTSDQNTRERIPMMFSGVGGTPCGPVHSLIA